MTRFRPEATHMCPEVKENIQGMYSKTLAWYTVCMYVYISISPSLTYALLALKCILKWYDDLCTYIVIIQVLILPFFSGAAQ